MAFRDGRQVVTSIGSTGTTAYFASLIKYEAAVGQELRSEENTTARYHGRATTGAATDADVWEIVEFTKDASEEIVRCRYLSGVAWDDRATIFP
jgi:hypothetical protein